MKYIQIHSHLFLRQSNIFKYTMITFTYMQMNYEYIPNFKYIQVYSNTFKNIKIL